ncbi:MAG TPA: hypothetical protein PLS26_07220 [Bacteroidales bacterium]|nr:hypothetical protein [Bacteroidales bacterium]
MISPKLYNLPAYKTNTDLPKLLRIILTGKYTRIDFGYQSNSHIIRCGGVNIYSKTYLHIHKTEEKHLLLRSENIPVKPGRHHFKSTVDKLYFSLFFSPLPDRSLTFDIIEEESDTPGLFNYFNIRLNKEKGFILLENF